MQIKGFLESKSSLNKETLIAYGKALIRLEKFLLENKITDTKMVDKFVLTAFVNKLESENLKINTINRYISIINNYFEYLLKNGYIDNSVSVVKIEEKLNEIKKIITFFEFEEIIKNIKKIDKNSKRNILLMKFIFFTDLKLNEILDLKFSDLNEELELLSIENRVVVLHKSITESFQEFEIKNSEKFIFLTYQGNKLSRQSVWKFMNKYSHKLNVEISTEKLNRSYKINKAIGAY